MANVRAQQQRMLAMKDPWIVIRREETGYAVSLAKGAVHS